MDKLLLNKKGYFTIELSIIISILIFSTYITIIYINSIGNSSIYIKEKEILEAEIVASRQLAINTNKMVFINFNDRYLTISCDEVVRTITFKSLSFFKSKELYFNKKGIINQAYTIMFKDSYKINKIVFYLGKGWFKIE